MDENTRVNVAAREFWIKGQKAFMDVRVFNPLAKTYQVLKLHIVATNKKRNESMQNG